MKTIVITGSTDGIGKLTALKLAKDKNHILIHGRNQDKIDQTVQELKEDSKNDHITGLCSDLSDFDSFQKMTSQMVERLSETKSEWKLFMQSLYVDLTTDSSTKPSPIHLGFKAGTEYLNTHLKLLESHGVNHVILNLKYGSRPADEVITEIGEKVVPNFS